LSKVVAIAGLGEEAPRPPSNAMLAWVVVTGVTVGIFVGTLLLNPSRKRGR
jgi:hypothetical protein